MGVVGGVVGQTLVPRHRFGAVLCAVPVCRLEHHFLKVFVVASLEGRRPDEANGGEGQNSSLGEDVGRHCTTVQVQKQKYIEDVAFVALNS